MYVYRGGVWFDIVSSALFLAVVFCVHCLLDYVLLGFFCLRCVTHRERTRGLALPRTTQNIISWGVVRGLIDKEFLLIMKCDD